jgi:hypothetical protein
VWSRSRERFFALADSPGLQQLAAAMALAVIEAPDGPTSGAYQIPGFDPVVPKRLTVETKPLVEFKLLSLNPRSALFSRGGSIAAIRQDAHGKDWLHSGCHN